MIIEGLAERANSKFSKSLGNLVAELDDLMYAALVVANADIRLSNVVELL